MANISQMINITIATLRIPAVDFISEIIIAFRVSKWVRNLRGLRTLMILIIIKKLELEFIISKSTILKITITKSSLDQGSDKYEFLPNRNPCPTILINASLINTPVVILSIILRIYVLILSWFIST